MPSNKCCVPKCTVNKAPFHIFPLDDEMRSRWCQLIMREDLLQKDVKTLRNGFRICDAHFAEEDKFMQVRNRTNLKAGSFPRLNLPGREVHGPPTPSAVQPALEPVAGPSSAPDPQDTAPTPTPVTVTRRRQTVSSIKGNLLRKRRNLLLEVQLRKQAQLTPKAATLYKIANEYKQLARKLQVEVDNNTERIEAAIAEAQSGDVFRPKVNAATYRFLQSQITQQHKAPRGRRFTEDDKLLSLALMKQGPKSYRLLRKIFALPSRKTLMAMLAKVPFECGVNEPIFQSLAKSIAKLKARDRHCILMFDEMALQPSLIYNKANQRVEGFQETNADDSSRNIADHAMVFMVKGIAKSWKQPISYYFSQNGMNNAEIAKNLKVVIQRLQDMGFVVDATVCDQYNKPAINMLVEESRRSIVRSGGQHDSYSFFVNAKEILPLFDFPHLLKGIRNNMLKYDVRFTWRSTTEVASWKHIEQLYDLDFHEDDDFRMLERLTDEHVKKEKIKKMKVKIAAQVFSHRVQSVMRGLVIHGQEGAMPKEAIGTANFLLFMDKLFDSVNGSCLQPKDNKPLRRAVSTTTPHVAFWEEALQVLRSMKFFNDKKEFVPPSVTNWILSVRNVQLLWAQLQRDGFDFLLPRSLNQDPLENFFSCIRSHGVRNVNPSCSSFKSAFKALIINNFMGAHSVNANCEDDETAGILDSLKSFLRVASSITDDVLPLDYGLQHQLPLTTVKSPRVISLYGYLAGYMAKRIIKRVGKCVTCRQELTTEVDSDEHALIRMREYKRNSLLKPRTKFVTLFNVCVQILHHWLPQLCHETNLHTQLFLIVSSNVSTTIFNVCKEHDLFKMFIRMLIDFYIFTWVQSVNRILRGAQSTNINACVKQQALRIHWKYKAKHNHARRAKHLQ